MTKYITNWDILYCCSIEKCCIMLMPIEIIKALSVNMNEKQIHNCIALAYEYGHLDVIRFFGDKYILKTYLMGLIKASQYGHLDIIRYLLIEKLAHEQNYVLEYASRYNNKHIIDFLLSEFNTDNPNSHKYIDIHSGLLGACVGGHLDLVKFFVETHNIIPTSYHIPLARKYGHSHIIDYFESINIQPY